MEHVKLKDICDVFVSIPTIQKDAAENAYFITPSNLYDNNLMIGLDMASISKNTNNRYVLKTSDILIKRLNPVFVNVFTAKDYPAYSSSNIIVVRHKRACSAEYIAAIFGVYGIESMTHYAKKGVTIQAISARELSEISIPLVSIDEQNKIGALWGLYQRKRILQDSLKENENLHICHAIKTILKEEK